MIIGFNYGRTTAYGSQVTVTGALDVGSVNMVITGLSPGTTYHYQAFATNDNGTIVSPDATFITLPILLEVSSIPVKPISLSIEPSGFSVAEDGFLSAFRSALTTGGQWMNFAFSDGVTTAGRIYKTLCVLWVTDESSYFSRHSHQYNSVAFFSEQKLQMLARDVPYGVRLYANDYLDISDPDALIRTSYKIVTNIMKMGILTLTLNSIRTTPEYGGVTA